MTSFELDIIDEKSRAGAEFLARIVEEMQRALVAEKSIRKLTQQSIAEKLGTSRHVINRELQGLENVTARRIGEFFWAIGWEPHFEAMKVTGQNCDFLTPRMTPSETALSNAPSPISFELQTERIDGNQKIKLQTNDTATSSAGIAKVTLHAPV